MSGSCAVCVDRVLYLFGGHHSRGNTNKVSVARVTVRTVYATPLECVCSSFSTPVYWALVKTSASQQPLCVTSRVCVLGVLNYSIS